jgi:predicted nuclease of predicted toxin-antitoxin system
VKFLVDNQLPAALAVYLRKKGMDCEHVLDAGLAEAPDAELCKYAAVNERIIISKDEDFFHLSSRPKASFQLIWVRLRNCRTAAPLEAFEHVWLKLEASLKAGERVIEIR